MSRNSRISMIAGSIVVLVVILLLASLSAHAQGPAYPYSVSLNFTASTSSNVTGYNMYRAPYTLTSSTCGTFSKVNTALFTATSYTDSNPPEGAYCYGSTAVNNSNAESGMSNIVKGVMIPPPPPTNLGATVAGTTVNFQWQQSTSPTLAYNTVWCRPSTTVSFNKRWQSTKPVTAVALFFASGTHYCAVTATDTNGAMSGVSNQVLAKVQ